MSRPNPDPSAVLALRFDIANLRVQIRLAENLVAGLDEFEREWERFVGAIRSVIERCKNERLAFWSQPFEEDLKRAEAIRLDLSSRMHIVLPEFRDPLAKFVRTSVRTYSDVFWSLIGRTVIGSDGQLLVPLDADGDEIYQVDPRRFEVNIGEAQSEIARRRRTLTDDVNKLKIMLEESERARGEARQMELVNTREVKLMPLVWERLKSSTIGKVLWWFGEEPLRKALGALLGAGVLAALPPVRHAFAALIGWIVSWFR